MENTTPFDLNDAIRNWRTNMAASSACSANDLDELECHVRDSVDDLTRKGLSPEEGFWLAMRRLGNLEALAGEFGKLNTEKIWLNRALWMMSGYVIIGILFGLGYLLANSLTIAAQVFIREANALGVLNLVLDFLLWPALLIAIWRTGNNGKGLLWRLADWAKAHPFLTGFGIFLWGLIGFGANYVLNGSYVRSMPMETYGVLSQWRYFGSLMPILLWAVVMTWLLQRNRRLAAQHN